MAAGEVANLSAGYIATALKLASMGAAISNSHDKLQLLHRVIHAT